MAYNIPLSERVRTYLYQLPALEIEEKRMFGGLAFLVNGKMCVNVSKDNLMCRFDPARLEELAARPGYMPMVMRGKAMDSYCYVAPEGYEQSKDFDFWMKVCLEYNEQIK